MYYRRISLKFPNLVQELFKIDLGDTGLELFWNTSRTIIIIVLGLF